MSSIEEKQQYGIHGTLVDGRTIAHGDVIEIVKWVKDIIPPVYLQVNIPNLNNIDCILDVNLKTLSPPACAYGICEKKITTHATGGYPVVGFTVTGMTYISSGLTATGVTVTARVVAIGW